METQITENETNNHLINLEKLKNIFEDIFKVFRKHNLNHGEICFVASELITISENYDNNNLK